MKKTGSIKAMRKAIAKDKATKRKMRRGGKRR